MAFPTDAPVLTQAESVDAIAEAEAGIAQCLQELFCKTLLPTIVSIPDPYKQISLTRTLLCAYSAKENAMGCLISALSKETFSNKGLLTYNNKNNCTCD